jgi:hypothetical protein
MKIHIPILFVGVVLLALPFRADAALVFENTEVEVKPTITDKTAVAHYKYKNTGDKPVKITQVQPSCGCTTAALAKDVVAPGESGEIVATLNIGERFGEQTKTIHVRTDDAQSEGTVLKLKANIPRLLEITPTFLYWRVGEQTPKSIEVKLGGDFPVTKLNVTSSDPAIKVESAPVPNEKKFRITVTPPGGNRPINAALKIQPDFPKDAPKTFYANVRVDAPHTAGAQDRLAPPAGPMALMPDGKGGVMPRPMPPLARRPGLGAAPAVAASPATATSPAAAVESSPASSVAPSASPAPQ